MENDNLIVGGQAEIALNSGAQLQCSSEGDEAILGKSGAMMQAPVRESGPAGIERIRP